MAHKAWATAAVLLLLAVGWLIRREGCVWTILGETRGDNFGNKVASAGDINGDGYSDAAVWASNHGDYAGKIYVFLGSARGLSRTPAWAVQGESRSDQYGRSFGTVGDVNGDGFGDFIVAAEGFDAPNLMDAGKAYLYLGSAKGISTIPSWTRFGHSPHELFGDCSGRAGDINQDGLDDVLIGAFGHKTGIGAAYVFYGSKQGLPSEAVWSGEGEEPNDWFGYSVASAANITGDGRPSLVLGAKQHRKGSLRNVGKVYVYHSGKDGLPRTPSWTMEGENAQDLFGWRALSAGDVSKSGYDSVLVSAYEHSGPAGANAGKIYLYTGSPNGLSPQPSWTADGEASGALFGYSIASGDFNGDGYQDVVAGSSGFRNHTGKVYLYLGGPKGLPSIASWTETGGAVDVYFGGYVANAGDVNGDGYQDLLVGSPYNSENGERSGKAYLFYGNKSGNLSLYPPFFSRR